MITHRLTGKAVEYIKARREGLNIKEAYQKAGYTGNLESSAPYQVEARTKIHIVDMLDSGRLLEILTRVQEIALSTLKAQKPGKLSQLEGMSIKLAYDLAITELRKPIEVKKPVETQDDQDFDPSEILARYSCKMETTNSENSA